MLYILACFLFILVYVKVPVIRIAVSHPLRSFFTSISDFVDYVYLKKYNLCPVGEMVCFTGLFGKGKTLSAVHTVRSLYRRYNNRVVYDPSQNAFVRQKIVILSNVTFNDIPFIPLTALSEVVSQLDRNVALDKQEHTYSVVLVLIDEASVQLNSRSFRSNMNADFINSLLTCRHYHASFFYTSQRFNLTDKLLRDVTQLVVDCNKIWRFQVQTLYDAWKLENCSDPSNVSSIRTSGFFILDSDYKAYDTLAVVSNLKKSWSDDDMLSDKEILELRNANSLSIDFSSKSVLSSLMNRSQEKK